MTSWAAHELAVYQGQMRFTCPWCKVPGAEDVDDPSTLCEMHEAEYEGLSVDELRRRDREQLAEWNDIYG